MSFDKIEVRVFGGPDQVQVGSNTEPDLIVMNIGPKGDNGPNSVTSATTSDGTANLSLGDLEVAGGEIYTDGEYSNIYTQGASAEIFTIGSDARIYTQGEDAHISTSGENAAIGTSGASATIYTLGANAPISTSGVNSVIATLGTNATISTAGSAAHIQTSHASAAVKSTNFAAVESGGASLVDGSMQPCLTWSAGGRNLTIPSGTAVTFDSTSYTYGTGAAAAHRTALGLTTLATTTPAANVATFLATPTSANLALALTDENGTGGGFVRAEGATLTSPTMAGTPSYTATSYTFAADARIGFLNNLSSQFVYKNGTIPYAEIFEDFPVTAGTHSFVTVSGTTAYYAASSSSAARYWGAISMTTGSVTDNNAMITLAPSGGAGGQTTSRTEMCHQICFCVNNATSSEFRARFQGGGQAFNCAVLFGTGVVQLEATNIGGAGVNSVSVATGLTLAAGDFISGTRYRLFVRCISATQTEVYFASAPWNSATWTTLVDTTITHSTPTSSFASTQPVYFVTTKTNAARIAYIDWVAIRYAIQR